MAELSKISGVAIADVAAVDAVLKANIASILGLTLPSGAAFLLDTYTGAAAGYSVRRLATSATVLLRVRRDTAGGTGDDDEADVAYDSNNILSLDSAISNASAGVTATTLGQFLNVGTVGGTTYTNPDSLTVTASCFVDEWKDQSGNANHASQATQGNQPQIHDGTVDTDLITENGKPAVFCADNNDGFDATAGAIDVTARTIYQWSVYSLTGVGNYPTITPSALYEGHDVSTEIPRTGTNRTAFTGVNAASAINTNQAYLRHSYADTTDFKTFLDGSGTAIISGTDTNTDWATSDLQIFDKQTAATGEIKLSEFVMWQSDQSSNRTGIESDINSEYLIYQPTDTPTSGLLATYSGAAAAYSVRQLADTAVIAMTVRRDSDDEEKRFGFDANGDLDTAGIASFCDTANGYVSQWWDQSTNGNHASQGTAASQPQIYDGTAVVTENGKPALQWDGSDDTLQFTTTSSTTTCFIVQASSDTGAVLISDFVGERWHFILQDGNTSTNLSGWIAETATDAFGYKNGSLVATQGTNTRDQLHTALGDGSQNLTSWTDLTLGEARIYVMGRYTSGVLQYAGKVQEVVLYNTDHEANRTNIETDINDYFSIY